MSIEVMIFQSFEVCWNLMGCLFILRSHTGEDSGGHEKNGLATHQCFLRPVER